MELFFPHVPFLPYIAAAALNGMVPLFSRLPKNPPWRRLFF